MMKNNLIALLDQTYPGVNDLFDSPVREDGSQKWVDFATAFWHVDCVRNMSFAAFTERYRKWCKRNGYNFSQSRAIKIHTDCLLYTSGRHTGRHGNPCFLPKCCSPPAIFPAHGFFWKSSVPVIFYLPVCLPQADPSRKDGRRRTWIADRPLPHEVQKQRGEALYQHGSIAVPVSNPE